MFAEAWLKPSGKKRYEDIEITNTGQHVRNIQRYTDWRSRNYCYREKTVSIKYQKAFL